MAGLHKIIQKPFEQIMNLKKRHLYLLTLVSGLLLTFGWPADGFPLFLFFAFVPLLIIEDFIYNHKEKFNRFSFFGYVFLSMLVWNLLTTYWIYFSTVVGVTLAVLLNSLFMALTLSLFHFTRTVLKHNSAYFTFILYWIAFEFLHLNWDLTWSWMNLGNGFANHPAWVQWYEFTGTFGGALWILLVNYLIFHLLKLYISKGKTLRFRLLLTVAAAGLILLPIIISVIIYSVHDDKGKSVSVVVVQPNIDPYNEKFGGLSSEKQLARLLKLARLETDANTRLLVGPETVIPEGVWEDMLDESRSIDSLKHFIKKYPDLSILVGLSSYKMFKPGETLSATARRYSKTEWYDAYNTAMMLDTSDVVQLYHKSKLVPGVEKMPWSEHLTFLEKYALDLGGIVGSLGVQDERSVFYSADSQIKAAPVICYESIYGEYVSEYVKNGANIICVITNDGWWEDTPGYKQHFDYASLRAIETRRSVVQSANTGISGFINQRGQVQQKTGWWKGDVLKQDVRLNEEITFYVKYGDYIGKASFYMSAIILLYSLILSISKKIKRIFIRKKSLG
ncbi:MAG: apolipoprotein N-acyltransferase [Bacteroidota bacterium]